MTKDEAIEVLRKLEAYCADVYRSAQVRGCEPAHRRADEMAKLARTAIDGLASEAVAEKLANDYVSGTVVSDFHGPKVTLRYRTTAAADAAFEVLTDAIDRRNAAPPAADSTPVPAQTGTVEKDTSPKKMIGDQTASDTTTATTATTDGSRATKTASPCSEISAQGIDHACPKDTPYGPATCGACFESNSPEIEGIGIDHACTLTDAELADPEYVRAYIEGCNESFAEAMAEIERLRQARGQQAGVPEGWADDLRAIENVWGLMGEPDNDEQANAIFAAGEALERILAAAPGEAG